MRSVDFLSILMATGMVCAVSVSAQEADDPKPKPPAEKKAEPKEPAKPEKKKTDDTKPTEKGEDSEDPKEKTKDGEDPDKNKQVAGALGNDALGRYIQSRFNQLSGSIEDLRAANALQARKIEMLTAENEKLRALLTQISVQSKRNFATQGDIREIQSRVEEVDRKRISDREKILVEFTKLLRKISKIKIAAPTPTPPTPPDKPQEKPIKTIEHTVAKGDFLGGILAAYNEMFRKQKKGRITMTEILKANPKLDPEKIFVGRKIYIPLPGEIK